MSTLVMISSTHVLRKTFARFFYGVDDKFWESFGRRVIEDSKSRFQSNG